jgi:hypothetical protein
MQGAHRMEKIRNSQPVRKTGLATRRRERLAQAERSLASASAALDRAERRGDTAARKAAMRKVLWAAFAREEARGAEWLRETRREQPGWRWRTQLALNFPARRIAAAPPAPGTGLTARLRMQQLETSRLWSFTTPDTRTRIAILAGAPDFGPAHAIAIGRLLDEAAGCRSSPLWLPGVILEPLVWYVRDRGGLWRLSSWAPEQARNRSAAGTA